MKAINARYQHGFLYDTSTGKRIKLAEGSNLSITIEPQDILEPDPYNKPHSPLSAEERLFVLGNKKKFTEGITIKKKGEKLFFEINAGMKSQKTYYDKYLFSLTLQEDLLGARKEKDKAYSLVDTICTVDECLSNNLPLFEPIYAESLSDAYMKTYAFYFRLFGKGTANVKDKMMEEPGRSKVFLSELLKSNPKPHFQLEKLQK